MRKRCSWCWNFCEAGVSTSDFLPTHPIFLSRGNVLPFVSTFLTVSIIVKRMVELRRFFHIPPHCSRFHRQRKYLPSPRNQSTTKLPSFLSFFLSFFCLPFIPQSIFPLPILYSLLLRWSTSGRHRIILNRIGKDRSDRCTRSNWNLPWNYPRFVILDFIGGSVLLHLLASPESCSCVSNDGELVLHSPANLEFFNTACWARNMFREMDFRGGEVWKKDFR